MAEGKRIQFRSFAERIGALDVDVARKIEFVASEKGVEELSSSHFLDAFTEWRQKNRTEDSSSALNELYPLIRSLPMVVYNLNRIVGIILRHHQKPDSMATEPLLNLLGTLARDVRKDFTPHFPEVFSSLVGLLDPQRPDLIEQVFQCIAYLLKYLARYVVEELHAYANIYAQVLIHPKHYIRQFAGESFAFLIRRLPVARMEDGVKLLMSQLDEEQGEPPIQNCEGRVSRVPGRLCQSSADVASLADALSVIFFECVRAVAI